MFRQKLAAVPLATDPSIRRSHLSPNELISRPAGDELKIVGDIFSYIAKKYGDKTACSYRNIVDIVEEKKMVPTHDGSGEEEKMWKYFTLSPPIPVTYTQLDISCNEITSGLVSLGFTDRATPIVSRPRVSIYADTCLNWQLMAQSFARLGHVITTAYTTMGEAGLLASLVEPDVELVFCGEPQLDLISKVIGQAEKVRYVVYDGEDRVDKATVEKISSVLGPRGGRILAITELRAMGVSKPLSLAELGPRPTEDDIFCIMYTSGSTGPPKGVLLSNKNMIASLAGSTKLWEWVFQPGRDLLLAYLPLTHILEQFLEYTFYLFGTPLGYATAKTLLDDNVRNCQGDFSAYKPTLLCGVPAIFEMIRKGMMKKIYEAGPTVGRVFDLGVKGKQNLPWPLSAGIDRLLFSRVKAATGGRLRYAVCGGGALSTDTQAFLSTVMAPMMQGYGLTETCGMTAITTPDKWQLGSVGALGPSTEAKLIDHPDLGYLSTNNPPQGEVWLRGPNVFQGYFKLPELTKESLTEDGWFKTGDIGQWEANGLLSIIDRVKNLIKLSNGEYIALDRLESIYKTCDVIMMLCVCAPPYADRPIALVYPHEGNLRNYLKAANLPSGGTPSQWVSDPKVKKFIFGQMLDAARKGGLKGTELIRDIVLTPEEWSPDNGMVTPAMKLARPYISKTYAKEIEAAYGRK